MGRGRESVHRLQIAQAHSAEVGRRQTAPPDNIAQRIAAGIAISGSVGHFAHPNAVEHDPNYAREHKFESNRKANWRLLLQCRNDHGDPNEQAAGNSYRCLLDMRPVEGVAPGELPPRPPQLQFALEVAYAEAKFVEAFGESSGSITILAAINKRIAINGQ
jgi:hypothetical protein